MPSPTLSFQQARPRSDREDEQWMSAPETQPLLEQDTKPEPDTTPPLAAVDPAPAPRGISPIQLSPDRNLSADYPFDDEYPQTTLQRWRRHWSAPDVLGSMSQENRSVLGDIGRGCLIVLSTPFAFAGMALYSVGVIIEGMAMVFKGVGQLGGKLLMKRGRGSESPRPEIWV